MEFLDQAVHGIGGMFAGRDYSAPTADQPQQCRPEDAGPLGFLGGFGQTLGDLGRGLSQEGLSGLLDPSGMLDRQSAQRELASQFNVMDPSHLVSGPGGPASYAGNQVSPEEFQQIARTYSDIRMDRSDLHVNTAGMKPEDAARMRGDTMGDIGNLLQTDSGRALVGSLAHQTDHHQTNINLRTDATGARDPSNADGGAAPGAVPGSWADGKGTNAEVNYVPGDAGGIQQPTMSDAWLPLRSDVTLFHELTHAHHAAYGTLDQTVLGAGQVSHPDDVGQNGMEYQAVGLGKWAGNQMTENSYRAERNAIGATNIGERTTGGVTDDAMAHRDGYVWHNRPAPAPAPAPGP